MWHGLYRTRSQRHKEVGPASAKCRKHHRGIAWGMSDTHGCSQHSIPGGGEDEKNLAQTKSGRGRGGVPQQWGSNVVQEPSQPHGVKPPANPPLKLKIPRGLGDDCQPHRLGSSRGLCPLKL